MERKMKRRSLLKAGAAAMGCHVVARHVLGGKGKTPPSDTLNVAGIGVGGQGGGLLGDREFAGLNVVALCDVDYKYAANTFKKFPKAERFRDYRVMLKKCKGIDAAIIATPDHMHAPIALAAMRAGKHVYVEKPLAHTIEECRLLTKVAGETKLVTQMGNNGHGGEGIRRTRELIGAGAIGTVREIHCWSDRPGNWWKQGLDRPTARPAVPKDLDWDLWLACAPKRPYHPVYHPRSWRGWHDFGTGALGDMAVHNVDPAFYALDLGAPSAAEARTAAVKPESFPTWQIITYEFAAAGTRPARKLLWYDGGKMPPVPKDLPKGYKLVDNGIYFVGDEGTILCGGWSGMPGLFPASRRKSFAKPPKTIARSKGHRIEWAEACKAGKPGDAKSGFAYSGPFTEALLVGVLAARLQKRIEWDAVAMKATNAPEADPLIRKAYRRGFGI